MRTHTIARSTALSALGQAPAGWPSGPGWTDSVPPGVDDTQIQAECTRRGGVWINPRSMCATPEEKAKGEVDKAKCKAHHHSIAYHDDRNTPWCISNETLEKIDPDSLSGPAVTATPGGTSTAAAKDNTMTYVAVGVVVAVAAAAGIYFSTRDN